MRRVTRKYDAAGPEADFEPGSRGRVLRNLLAITRVRDMEEAESQALEIAQDEALRRFAADHQFTAKDICILHGMWLGPIYEWAGRYRRVNLSKAGFQFAHAPLIENLMADLERNSLHQHTPCRGADDVDIAAALAEVHVPPLDFSPLLGRGKRNYIAGIHAALNRDYATLADAFGRVIARSRWRVASSRK